ncbi:MAG: tyrosine-type recombinase/integrase [Acholeplasmataceae bacterium]|nr:tyrosine-type recombinase/integrase [Acholeplasmataceae bacterium]
MTDHPLEDLVDLYLAEKDIKRETWELYHTILIQYIAYLKTQKIIYAKKSDVLSFIDYKKRQNYSTQWIYHLISTIKGLYQYLAFNQKRLDLDDIYAYDITESIKNVSIKKKFDKQTLEIHEAKHLILCTKQMRKYIWHYRDHAIIYLMIVTGIRSVEVRRARIKDLKKINSQHVLYIQGKGMSSKDDYVKISKGLKDAIDDYLNLRSDKNPYLFISHSKRSDVPYLSRTFFNRMLKRVLGDSGFDPNYITAHCLRHTAASLNLKRGGSLEETKRFMRHSNLSTTLIYSHMVKTIEDDTENQVEHYILNDDSDL